jgi:hypothetical protein
LQRQGEIAEREMPLYYLFRNDVTTILSHSFVPESVTVTWIEYEYIIFKFWMERVNESQKENYRRIYDASEVKKQFASDCHTVLSGMAMRKMNARTASLAAKGVSPLAATASLMAENLTRMHNPELAPPIIQTVEEDEFVVPPSTFRFRSTKAGVGGGIMSLGFSSAAVSSAPPHRPPPGFVAFVIDTNAAFENDIKRNDRKPFVSESARYLEIVGRWQALADADIQKACEREITMEAVGSRQEAIRAEIQMQHLEASRAAFNARVKATSGIPSFQMPSVVTVATTAAASAVKATVTESTDSQVG